jgi:hypothetical protein
MPAKSIKQQRFFGMVRAAQKGEMENPSSEVAQAAASMSKSDVKKFAKTKHKGLPMKKKVDEGFKTDLLKDRKYAKGVAEKEKQNKERDARMKHGKNWKEFTRDVESAKKRLRPGEVKKWDPVQKKYVSNKD